MKMLLDDVKRAIKTVEEKGGKLKGLAFIFGTNPGRLLDEEAVEVASLFMMKSSLAPTHPP